MQTSRNFQMQQDRNTYPQQNTSRDDSSGHQMSANLTSEEADKNSMKGFALKRSKGLRKENESEYFYKDLIVEPRKNVVFKQWSDPFKVEDLPATELKAFTI